MLGIPDGEVEHNYLIRLLHNYIMGFICITFRQYAFILGGIPKSRGDRHRSSSSNELILNTFF